MAYTETPTTSTDKTSPIDEVLMEGPGGFNTNIKDHEVRILALEGSSGQQAEQLDDPRIGVITSGLSDNTAKLWHKRFGIFESTASRDAVKSLDGASDIEGSDLNERWVGPVDISTADGNAAGTGGSRYKGKTLSLAKSKKISFKLKKGENFFGIIYSESSTTSDSVTVTVDGTGVDTLVLVDENNVALTATFSTVKASGSTMRGKTQYFFGLDAEEENIVTIENTDSGTDVLATEGIEVGFKTEESTVSIGHDDVRVSAGSSIVRGQAVTNAETTLSFTEDSGYGRTDMLISDTDGALSVVEGVKPAMTQVRPGVTLSQAATSIEVKNHHFFPDAGFLSVHSPYGQYAVASYTGRSNITFAAFDQQTFDSVLWQSPLEGISPLSGFNAGAGNFEGDVIINYLGSGGLEIDSTNNKIDFKIKTDNDVSANTFAATVASGLYAADIVCLGDAIIDAMVTAKALPDGSYFAEWSEMTQKWQIGIKGSASVEEFELLFATGTNVANSIHTDIGFGTTDLSAALSYLGTTAKQHKVSRALEMGEFEFTDSPNIKYDYVNDLFTAATNINTASNQFLKGLRPLRYLETQSVTETGSAKIYTDKDCSGLMFYYLANDEGTIITAQVDGGQNIYALQTDRSSDDSVADAANDSSARIISAYISFPRGSHQIILKQESSADFEIAAGTNRPIFVGFRQLRTRPKLESLSLIQSGLKFYDVKAKTLYKSVYEAGYTPAGSLDNVDALTQTGTWTTVGSTNSFNGSVERTSTANDTLDIQFTLVGSGGGISCMLEHNTTGSAEINAYLNAAAAASEVSTKLLSKVSVEFLNTSYSHSEGLTLLGLPAGTYTLRIKVIDGTFLDYSSFSIWDTVDPDENSINIGELTNTGQGVGYAWPSVAVSIQKDNTDRVPVRLLRSGYKEGEVISNYRLQDGFTFIDRVDVQEVLEELSLYGNAISTTDVDAEMGTFVFARSINSIDGAFTTNTTTVTPNFDSRADSTYDYGVQVVGGTAPSATLFSFWPLSRKYYQRNASGDMSDETTFLVDDTRGMRDEQVVRISADGETTVTRRIVSISADTSITLNKDIAAFANYTTANNARVDYSGFHNVTYENDNAASFPLSGFTYEPLPILEHKGLTKRFEQKMYMGQLMNYALSESSGAAVTTSASAVDITNLEIKLITSGNPVLLCLIPSGEAADSILRTDESAAASLARYCFIRDITPIAQTALQINATGATAVVLSVPGSVLSTLDFAPAGSYIYKARFLAGTGSNARAERVKLLAIELTSESIKGRFIR